LFAVFWLPFALCFLSVGNKRKQFLENGHHVNPDYKFCPRCAGKLQKRFAEGRDRLVCEKCEFIFYQNPAPAVAAILMRGNEVLLVKRKYEPRAGTWSLPAGFLEMGEGPEHCTIREAKEETNLDIAVDGLFGVYPGVDDPRSQVVLIVYRGVIKGGELRPGDDAMEAQFFNLTQLPADISFESHRKVLAALRKEMIQ
jgi:ADP-ribose pyrophosphatase YjhB (NUDIX family)